MNHPSKSHYRIVMHTWNVNKTKYPDGNEIHTYASGCVRYGFYKNDEQAKTSAREVWQQNPNMIGEIKVFDNSNQVVFSYDNLKKYGL